MKKISILIVVFVLIALATPLMAEVSISGNVKYGVTLGPDVDPDADGALISDEKREATITVTGKPDENNTATIKLDIHKLEAEAGGPVACVNKALFESYLLKSFGITDVPLTLKLSGGYFEVANKDVGKMSGYECEDVCGTKLKSWQIAVDAEIMEMVTLRVGVDPEFKYQAEGGVVGSGETASVGYVVGAFGGVEMVDFELFYTNSKAVFEQSGLFAAAIAADLDLGDIGLKVGFNLGMDLDENALMPMQLGIGLKLTYASMLMVGIGTYGYTLHEDLKDLDMVDSIVDIIGVNLEYTGVDNLTLYAGAKIGLLWDEDTGQGYEDALRLLDVGMKTKAGALEIGLGYQMRPETAADDPGKEDKYNYAKNGVSGGVHLDLNLGF